MIATVYVTKNFGFRRGEIYFADLDPHYGSEQGGKRPVIVIQNNTGNKFAPTALVAFSFTTGTTCLKCPFVHQVP